MNPATLEHESLILDRLLVPPDAAEAVLSLRFSQEDIDRMGELMEKNNAGIINADESAQMDAFRRIGSFLAIVQAKARLKLQSNGAQHGAA